MRAHVALTVSAFAAQLAPVLGNEQALAMVQTAVQHIGHRGDMLVAAQQRAVLAWLGEQPGVIGAAARHLLRQFDTRANAAATAPVRSVPPMAAPAALGTSVSRADLTAAFERAVGTERAREIIDKACHARGVAGERIPTEDAATVLEDLARVPGMVGVLARFAKARFALRASEPG